MTKNVETEEDKVSQAIQECRSCYEGCSGG